MLYDGKLRDLPFVSACLTAVCAVLFLIPYMTGYLQIYEAGVLDASAVLHRGEYGRILWSLFLHGDLQHLFNNLLILFFLGSMLEKEAGHVRFAAVCLLSGIGGNLLSLALKIYTMDPAVSLGASGMVFGLNGMLLALILYSEKSLPWATPRRVVLMIALSLYNGFTGVNVDNGAHVGGLITGFVITSILCHLNRSGGRAA